MISFISDGETAIPVSSVTKIIEQQYKGNPSYAVMGGTPMVLSEREFFFISADRVVAIPGSTALVPKRQGGAVVDVCDEPVIAWAITADRVLPITLSGLQSDAGVLHKGDPRVFDVTGEIFESVEAFRAELGAPSA